MNTDRYEKLKKLVARIERHQKALNESDSEFVLRYQRYLGSTDTWRRRLCGGLFGEIRIDKWTRELNKLVAEIDGGSVVEDFYGDMPAARMVKLLFLRLQGQTNDRRCAVMLGPTGIGKSTAARGVSREEKYVANTRYLRILPTWQGSPMQIVAGMAAAVGAEVKNSVGATFNNVLEVCKGWPDLILFIDDAHEAGVLIFKLVRALIDESRIKVFLLSYPTKWDKMVRASDDAHAEAQQLLGRTLKPILDAWREGTNQSELTLFLQRAAGLNGDAASLAAQFLPTVRRHGNLRYAFDAIENARMISETGEPTIEEIAESFKTLHLPQKIEAKTGGAL